MTDPNLLLRDPWWRHLCAPLKGMSERLFQRRRAWFRAVLGLIHGRPGVSVLINQAWMGSWIPSGGLGAISMVLLVGCQSIPIMVPDMAWRRASPARRIGGPTVAEFRNMFSYAWARQKGSPIADREYFPQLGIEVNSVLRAIGSSPEEPDGQIDLTLLSGIYSAESAVFFASAYLVTDPKLLGALKGAVQRGVDVRLLLPGKIDSVLVLYASCLYSGELLRSVAKIYERKGALLHAGLLLSMVYAPGLDRRISIGVQIK